MSPEVRRISGTDALALELVAAMVEEVGALYEPGLPAGSSAHPEELSPPGGGFVVLCEHGRPVAGGGIKRLDERACEVKRMYVVPAARGRGLGPALLAQLEQLARDLGYGVARLDTGDEMPGVRRMYEHAGYASVPDYNGNPYAGWWGEKRLVAARGERAAGGPDDGGAGGPDDGAAGGPDGRSAGGPDDGGAGGPDGGAAGGPDGGAAGGPDGGAAP